jgi:hypothetical protein
METHHDSFVTVSHDIGPPYKFHAKILLRWHIAVCFQVFGNARTLYAKLVLRVLGRLEEAPWLCAAVSRPPPHFMNNSLCARLWRHSFRWNAWKTICSIVGMEDYIVILYDFLSCTAVASVNDGDSSGGCSDQVLDSKVVFATNQCVRVNLASIGVDMEEEKDMLLQRFVTFASAFCCR